MLEAEAVALAAKREAHKSKFMNEKEWRALHDSAKGWHVALVDTAEAIFWQQQREARRLRSFARDALSRGDAQGFLDAAGDALLASVRSQFATPDTGRK